MVLAIRTPVATPQSRQAVPGLRTQPMPQLRLVGALAQTLPRQVASGLRPSAAPHRVMSQSPRILQLQGTMVRWAPSLAGPKSPQSVEHQGPQLLQAVVPQGGSAS